MGVLHLRSNRPVFQVSICAAGIEITTASTPRYTPKTTYTHTKTYTAISPAALFTTAKTREQNVNRQMANKTQSVHITEYQSAIKRIKQDAHRYRWTSKTPQSAKEAKHKRLRTARSNLHELPRSGKSGAGKEPGGAGAQVQRAWGVPANGVGVFFFWEGGKSWHIMNMRTG